MKRSTYRLLVLEGEGASREIPLRGKLLPLGRRPGAGGICLSDRSVARRQALLTWWDADDTYTLTNRSASSPTRVDGARVHEVRLRPGARIRMGRLLLEYRRSGQVEVEEEEKPARERFPLAERKFPQPREVSGLEPTVEMPVPLSPAEEEAPGEVAPPSEEGRTTAAAGPLAWLEVVRGWKGGERGKRFPVFAREITLGRSPECDISIPDRLVSRLHASVRWSEGMPVLHHHGTNPTLVNRKPVHGSILLRHGDRISLARRVEFLWCEA